MSKHTPGPWFARIFKDAEEGSKIMDDRCKCGEPSTRGCHGVGDGVVYSVYYCAKCYHEEFGGRVETADAIEEELYVETRK